MFPIVSPRFQGKVILILPEWRRKAWKKCNVITQEQAKANQEMAQTLEGLREVGHKLKDMAEGKNSAAVGAQ